MATRSYSRLSRQRLARLQESLASQLAEAGFEVIVELEESGLRGRYRLFVISNDFERLLELERQDIIWRALKEVWPREDQLRITLSLALTRAEAEGIAAT